MKRLLVALFVLPFALPLCLHACEAPGPVTSCSVVVEPGKFSAYFPVLIPSAQWRWKRQETPVNGMEYRWLVELGRCGDSGHFEPLDYTFSVEVFRFEKSVERTGSLTDLLIAAQPDVSRREVKDDGRVVYERLNKLHLSAASYSPTLIEVGSMQASAIETLFAKRPTTAYMTAYIPEEGQSYKCMANIQYR